MIVAVSRVGLFALVILALALAACGGGGQLSQKALHQEAKTVQSLAAEGGLLAGDAARGRTTKVFVREQAGFLHKAAASSAQKLARAGNGGALGMLAARVRDDLDRLSRSGADAAQQRRIGLELTRAAHAAAQLGKS
jgi:hypothetical protein